MAGEINKAWDEVEEVLKDKAPERFAELAPGADPSSLESFAAETKIGKGSELLASFALHDGKCDISDYTYVNHRHALAVWRDMNRYKHDDIFGGRRPDQGHGGLIKDEWWNDGWIPFAEDGGGNLLCVDNDPGPKGEAGQIIRFETDFGPGPTGMKSLSQWLKDFASKLKSGELQVDDEGYIS